MDTLTKQQRSKLMAKIHSSGNKSTELRFVELLRKWRLSGWRRNQRLPGQPDFVFKQSEVAIFIDGCFWHGCKQHCRLPAANHSYWVKKVSRNKQHDKQVNRTLAPGWLARGSDLGMCFAKTTGVLPEAHSPDIEPLISADERKSAVKSGQTAYMPQTQASARFPNDRATCADDAATRADDRAGHADDAASRAETGAGHAINAAT